MKPDKLVRMANQIAAFFRSYPEDEATTGIHGHIEAYWTPKMRDILMRHAEAAGDGLDPLVVRAMTSRTGAESPIEKELAGPRIGGQLASDAG